MSETKTNLAALQQFVQDALAGDAEKITVQQINNVIAPSQRLEPAQRLGIYKRGYYARLLECMRGQFKVLRQTLGHELFDDFAAGYLQAHPSENWTLAKLGERFPAYLSQTRPDRDLPEPQRETWIDFMIELARFEWEVFRIFDLPGDDMITVNDPAFPDDRLQLQRAFLLCSFRFPVLAYYRLSADGPPPEIPPPVLTHIALVRKNFRIGIFELNPLQFSFLGLLQKGMTIREALQQPVENTGSELVQQMWDQHKTSWLDAGFFISR